MGTPMLPEHLGDGLMLRRVRPADTEELVALKADHHRMQGAAEPDAFVAAWATDLLARPHPTFRPDWFLVVEDTATREIVSSLCMIPQTWTYGGIPFPVGRVEMVSTNPAYRRRGLVRRQMDVVHAWGVELGHQAQVILGIPWYYRQFGYEYAVAYGGSRAVGTDQIASQPADATESIRLRPAEVEDVPFIDSTSEHGASRYLVTCQRDEALWRYELEGRRTGERFLIVERTTEPGGQSEPIGFVAHSRELASSGLVVVAYELAPGVSWHDQTAELLRGLRQRGDEIAAEADERCARIRFLLGEGHPVYRTHRDLDEPVTAPYAWYVRVPHLPTFVRHIAPALEARLARSDFAGYSGDVKLGFFRDGLRLVFDGGRLVEALPWLEEHEGDADATFPPLTFLQLVFGRRTQTEIESVLPDCRVWSQRARLLIETLFPRQPSLIWAVM